MRPSGDPTLELRGNAIQYDEVTRRLDEAGQGAPAGRLYHAMGLEVPLYTPIFVMSRVAGWSAHVIEQLDNNRLIRPRARYTGECLRSVKALNERN